MQVAALIVVGEQAEAQVGKQAEALALGVARELGLVETLALGVALALAEGLALGVVSALVLAGALKDRLTNRRNHQTPCIFATTDLQCWGSCKRAFHFQSHSIAPHWLHRLRSPTRETAGVGRNQSNHCQQDKNCPHHKKGQICICKGR